MLFLRKRPRKRLTLDQMIAATANASGRCAYDHLVCDDEPVIWVEWLDHGRRGAGGYCPMHATVLILSRTVTYSSRAFPS